MKAWMMRVLSDAFRVGLWTTAVVGLGGLLMFHVWNQYRIVQVGYQIAEVTQEHRKLIEQNKKLAIEAAVVGRTERLSNVARERYGLEPVGPKQVHALGIDVAGAGVVKQGEHANLLQ